MIKMRMSQDNSVKLHTETIYCRSDFFGIVSRVDTDRLFRFFARDNSSVLLKCGSGNFFDQHGILSVVSC
jgi:hypothetical protein